MEDLFVVLCLLWVIKPTGVALLGRAPWWGGCWTCASIVSAHWTTLFLHPSCPLSAKPSHGAVRVNCSSYCTSYEATVLFVLRKLLYVYSLEDCWQIYLPQAVDRVIRLLLLTVYCIIGHKSSERTESHLELKCNLILGLLAVIPLSPPQLFLFSFFFFTLW